MIEAKIIDYDADTYTNIPTRPYRQYKRIKDKLRLVKQGRYNGVSEYDTIDVK